ncbi:hypothetical protein AVEN_104682-1 [Araneus ventricosus]|uniref:Uncharacterized protein n=1 Tax=Araneus ventricosus TaxID=182803 RepID=A0A4Y2BF44_ARAVE|nr:hypothetical protein AVEN_104682-1 [Araneus ventricosus]
MSRTTPELEPSSPSFHVTSVGRPFSSSTYGLACSGTQYTAFLQWSQVLSLEPSDSGAGTLPLGRRGPIILDEEPTHKI